jgi:hypothetical protein
MLVAPYYKKNRHGVAETHSSFIVNASTKIFQVQNQQKQHLRNSYPLSFTSLSCFYNIQTY